MNRFILHIQPKRVIFVILYEYYYVCIHLKMISKTETYCYYYYYYYYYFVCLFAYILALMWFSSSAYL
jgi:hypothetical protein